MRLMEMVLTGKDDSSDSTDSSDGDTCRTSMGMTCHTGHENSSVTNTQTNTETYTETCRTAMGMTCTTGHGMTMGTNHTGMSMMTMDTNHTGMSMHSMMYDSDTDTATCHTAMGMTCHGGMMTMSMGMSRSKFRVVFEVTVQSETPPDSIVLGQIAEDVARFAGVDVEQVEVTFMEGSDGKKLESMLRSKTTFTKSTSYLITATVSGVSEEEADELMEDLSNEQSWEGVFDSSSYSAQVQSVRATVTVESDGTDTDGGPSEKKRDPSADVGLAVGVCAAVGLIGSVFVLRKRKERQEAESRAHVSVGVASVDMEETSHGVGKYNQVVSEPMAMASEPRLTNELM